MNSPTHRIHSQKWFLTAGSVEEAIEVRRQIHKQIDSSIPGIYEKVFDGFSPNGDITHIPRLELKLKISSLQQLNEELPAILEKELSEKLLEVMATGTGKVSDKGNQTEKAINSNLLHDVIYYLRNGTLPWYMQQENVTGTLSSLGEILPEIKPQLITYINENNEEQAFYFRLFQLLSHDEGISFATELVQKSSQKWNEKLIPILTRLIAGSGSSEPAYLRFKTISVILYEMLRSKNSPVSPDFYEAVLREIIQQGNLSIDNETESILEELRLLNDKSTFYASEKGSESTLAVDHNKDIKIPVPSEKKSPGLTITGLVIPENETISTPTDLREYKDLQGYDKHKLNRDSTLQQERLTVFHAGIILLHPFIQRLFAATGITEEEKPGIPNHRLPRAAALLHYLATGNEEVFEFELGLIKVLLGLDPEFPLPVAAGLLNSKDKEEAEELLRSAITYWSILKDTSIPGFQGTFIQRRGILAWNDEHWTLHVERTSYDLLLDYLPWSISIVKLPWMKQPIFTEW